MKNIVLIGLSGCGKTTLAKKLSLKKTGLSFFDMDEEIERMEGTTISTIFEQKGEAYFRDVECKIAKKAAGLQNAVISTGGGIILRDENMIALQETGRIIFIDRPPELIVKDIETQNRPLIKGNPQRIFELYNQRIHLYRDYAFAVVINDKTEDEAFNELLTLVDSFKNSRKFTVIGHPIAHSLSPAIHHTVFTKLKENCEYEAIDVVSDQLAEWIEKVRRENISGFNVTMPLKVEIIPFLDEIDREAKLHNSVNTVVNENGRLKGYSTDAQGLSLALHYADMKFKDAEVLILGAGGVTNTVALKAAFDGAKNITILARTVKKAEELCKKINRLSQETKVAFEQMTNENISACAKRADILINATPLGMTGNPDNFENFDFLDQMKKNALVCDLIYSPTKTRLLEKAQEKSIKILNGLPMLIYQALLSDKYYLNMEFDIQNMQKIVLIGGKKGKDMIIV